MIVAIRELDRAKGNSICSITIYHAGRLGKSEAMVKIPCTQGVFMTEGR